MLFGWIFKAFDRSALLFKDVKSAFALSAVRSAFEFKAVRSALPFKAVRSALLFKAVKSALASTSELTVWTSSHIVGSAYILSLAEMSAHAVPAAMASLHLYIL